MAITITGGKYAVATLSSVGTTTVTCTGTPFTTADFNVPRRVDLFDNSLATFKGMAFVRRATSTSVLELETEFFNPLTGTTVTQVAGGSPDKIYVSKNYADVATTGLAVSGDVVTQSDTITWGTASDPDSLCFHDEDKIVNVTLTTANAKFNDVAGGVMSFGHLQSYSNKTHYGGCTFNYATTNSGNSFVPTSTAARLFMFGGTHKGAGSNPLYFGSGYTGSLYGTDWGGLWVLGTKFNATDVMSKSGGGNWTTGSNHILESCSFIGTGTNLILLRWANGTLLGGFWKIPNNASAPLAISGSDAATGTFEFGAPAGERAIVADMGSSNVFWRTSLGTPTESQTINITNLISTDYRIGGGLTPESTPNTNSTKNLYFLDNYTNLQDATVAAIIRDSDWSVDDSDTSSGAASTLAMQVFYGTGTGHTAPSHRGPWTYRIRKYGYDGAEGAIAQSDYSLGTAGTAKDVAFGGRVDQVANANMSGTAATALALAGITVTDHGASPVTWNSKAWSITITVDRTTYPSRTAAEVYRHIMAGIAQTSTFNGKTGLLWHELVDTDGSTYSTQRGISGGAGATNKGVRVVTDTGAAMPGFTAMVADDGTTYNPPDLVYQSVELSGLVSGSRVQIYDTTAADELDNAIVSGTTYTWTDTAVASATRAIRLRVAYVSGTSAKHFIEANIGTCGITSGTETVTYLVSQTDDDVYNANAVNGSSVTGVTFTDSAVDTMNIDVASAGTIDLQDIYAAWVYYAFTATGIATDIDYINAIDSANYELSNMVIKNTSSPSVPLKVTGGYAWDATTLDPIDLVDTTGGTLFLAPPHVVNNIVTVGGANIITGDIADVPTAAEIASQILTSAQSAPIYADVRKVTGVTVTGTGTDSDPWGP